MKPRMTHAQLCRAALKHVAKGQTITVGLALEAQAARLPLRVFGEAMQEVNLRLTRAGFGGSKRWRDLHLLNLAARHLERTEPR